MNVLIMISHTIRIKSEIVDNSRTDTNTRHSYLPLYQKLLAYKKETAKNVLEVGICWVEVYDLRENKNRYDDIVFTIDKSNN